MSHVLQHYAYLHEIPELGFQEFKTSAWISPQLKNSGYQVQEHVNDTTGIVAVLDSGVPDPTLALRADMDALGHIIDGKACARHTCGHDAHSSVVLAAGQELIAESAVKKGRLKLIFQPAEELGTGALAMTAGGAVDDVDMLLGFHLRPAEECATGTAIPAVYYSACVTLEATIQGKTAHGARPHLGVNALDAACHAVQAVNTVHMAPRKNWSAKATRFLCDAGVTNSIPDQARVVFDLRAAVNEDMNLLREKVERAIRYSVAAMDATVEIDELKAMPAAEISDEMTLLITDAIKAVLGEEAVMPVRATPGSEDFFHYAVQRPEIKAGFWGLGTGLLPGLHHPDMRFDLDSLPVAVRIFKACVTRVLG